MAGSRRPRTGLTLALSAVLAALQFAQVSHAQSVLPPIVFYNDASGDDAADVFRKNTLGESVKNAGSAYGATVLSGRPALLSLDAKTHIIMTNTLQDIPEENIRVLVSVVDNPGSMLVMVATPTSEPDYNNLLTPFLAQWPGCSWAPQSRAANAVFNFNGMPLSLFAGGSTKVQSFKCEIGTQWYTASDGTGPVYMFLTPRGGWVKLLGFDFGTPSRVPDWSTILLYVPPAPPSPPPPPPRPPPPPSPPPSPRPPVGSPPRRPPNPPPDPAPVTRHILITDPSTPSDLLRKTQLKLTVAELVGTGNVLFRSTPAFAPAHSVFDNTFIALSSANKTYLRDLVRRGKTMLAIVVTSTTSNTDLSDMVSALVGGIVICTKRSMNNGEDMTATIFSDFSNVLGVPRFTSSMIPAANTVAIKCNVGRQVVQVDARPEEGTIWEIGSGSGFFRLIGYDFTSGGYTSALRNITIGVRLPCTSSISAVYDKSMLPPAPPFSTPSPPKPPPPPPAKFPPPAPFEGRIPRIVQFSDLSPLPDATQKEQMRDGIDGLGSAPTLWPYGPVDGALVHVTFDTTLVRLGASALANLATMVRAKNTVLSIIYTTGVTDTQLSALLAALTGGVKLQCESGPVLDTTRVNRLVEIMGDLRSDGWRALNMTRFIRCNTGVIVFGVAGESKQGVVLEVSTIGGGTVRLIGYNFASGGRGDNRKPLSSLAVFAAPLVNQPALTGATLPPLPSPFPSPPPPPPPRPFFYRPPRPPGAALPPRPIRPPPPPLGPRYDAIVLFDPVPPNTTVDADRKAKFLEGVKELADFFIVPQTVPGNAPVHVTFDNTFLAMSSLLREDLLTRVLTRQTLLTIIITPQTSATDMSWIVAQTTTLANIQCTKERIASGVKFVASAGVTNDVVGAWRSEGGTTSVSCWGSSRVYETADTGRPVVSEFLTPGSGSVRFLGYDMSEGARGAGRISIVRLAVTPEPLTGTPSPSPPPSPPPSPYKPPSPRPPKPPVKVDPPPPPSPPKVPQAPRLPPAPPPRPPFPPLSEDAVLVAIIGDGDVTMLSADATRKKNLRDALNLYLPGSVGIKTLEYYPGVSSSIIFDNTYARQAFTTANKTALADAVNTGETLLTVIMTPTAATPSSVVSNMIKFITGYPASCSKSSTATSSSSSVTLTKVNADPFATTMPETISHSYNGVSITCTGIPEGAFIPIYTTSSGRTEIAEVITPTYGVIRLVGFDFTKTSQPATWASLLSYNFRIAAGAPTE